MGTVTLNRLMDRAGRHRRLASGLLTLVAPVFVMGLLVLRQRYFVFAICHFAVAGSLVLISTQLLRQGSLVDGHGLPDSRIASLFASVLTIRLVSSDSFTEAFGATSALHIGFGIMATSILVLAFADRSPDPLAVLAGRGLLVMGGTFTGCVQLIRASNGFEHYPGYAAALGIVGTLLLGMSIFEGRLLRSAIQLALLSEVH